MSRARGANAVLALGFEPTYGVSPASGYRQHAFVSSNLGDEQPLEASDLLGFGRDPQEPSRGAVDNTGDVVVPLCARNFGDWLKLMFGNPTTVQGLAATGSITFSDQPAANATITIGGQAFTFVAGTPTANQIKIGASVQETVANAIRALNASAVAGVMAATYRGGGRGNVIEITHDALGASGNSFALVSSSAAAVVSAATLTGGAATGGYQHTFITGAQTLPSASIEVGMPEVPSFRTNYGVKGNTLAVTLARSGNLNASAGLIAQGETPPAKVTGAGTPSLRDILRFSHFSGVVLRQGVPIADLVGGSINFNNGLDAVPAIGRGDGRISGIDEGMLSVTGSNAIRYSSDEFQQQAESGLGVEQEYAWRIPGTAWSLRMIVHRVLLPVAKSAITGPGGVQADYSWQAAEAPGLGRTATIILTNDVPSY